MQPTRRGFLIGAATLLAAPAIVRASSIMPVKAFNSEPACSGSIETIISSVITSGDDAWAFSADGDCGFLTRISPGSMGVGDRLLISKTQRSLQQKLQLAEKYWLGCIDAYLAT